MKIATGAFEEHSSDARENRITEISMKRFHRAGLDPAGETISHDQIESFAEFIDEGPQVRKIITVIRIAHDDELAARGCDAGANAAP